MPNLRQPLHIFKPGRHTALSGATLDFSAADLAASAAAYDPGRHEAPLVVGHPAIDAPAYGWVKALFASPDLEAEPHQVDAAFAEMVGAGRFKKISASFFMPDAPGNPVPGVYYLRHVGFLGAAAPAVKGLRTPEFAADEGGIETIEFSTTEFSQKEITRVTPEEKAALEAENAQLKQQIADASAREKSAAAARRHAEHASFCEGLVKEGRLTPGLASVIVATLDFVGNQEQVVEFAEGAAKSPLAEALQAALKATPPQIDFAELAADKSGQVPAGAEFSAPAGQSVDAARLDIHRRALAHQAAHAGIDYLTAVKAVS